MFDAAKQFDSTPEQKKKLRELMLAAEKIACDLDTMFKNDLLDAVKECPADFAFAIRNGGGFADKRLKALADAYGKAWDFFTFMDEIQSHAFADARKVEESKPEVQIFDVEYQVTHQTKVEVPLGESLVSKLAELAPDGQNDVKIVKVSLDGVELPNPTNS